MLNNIYYSGSDPDLDETVDIEEDQLELSSSDMNVFDEFSPDVQPEVELNTNVETVADLVEPTGGEPTFESTLGRVPAAVRNNTANIAAEIAQRVARQRMMRRVPETEQDQSGAGAPLSEGQHRGAGRPQHGGAAAGGQPGLCELPDGRH